MPDAAVAMEAGQGSEEATAARSVKREDDANRNSSAKAQQPGASNVIANKKKQTKKPRDKAGAPCRFWTSKKGCRAGDSCPFSHDPALRDGATSSSTRPEQSSTQGQNESKPSTTPKPSSSRKDNAKPAAADTSLTQKAPAPTIQSPVDPARIVSKPAPQTDPRTFQLRQLDRRFSPETTTSSTKTSLSIKLQPSDPDFPFEMPFLDCVLDVPTAYPKDKPKLHVHNKEMSRGFQINVERGFDAIVVAAPNSTLLRWLNTLDQKLEAILTGEKAETIKIVANRAPPTKSQPEPVPSVDAGVKPSSTPKVVNTEQLPTAQRPAKPQEPTKQSVITPEEISAAHARRTTEIRQLEARMGRLPTYSRSVTNEGIVYNIPIEPRRRMDLPTSLQSVKLLRLTVPDGYPLKPCKVDLQGVSGKDAEVVRDAWNKHQSVAKEGPGSTLMGRVNELAMQMHVWIKEEKEHQAAEDAKAHEPRRTQLETAPTEVVEPTATAGQEMERIDSEKSHVHYIPRPPEWNMKKGTESDSDSSFHSSDSELDDNSDPEDDSPAVKDPSATTDPSNPANTAPNYALDLPNMTLQGIDLLTIVTPSLTTRCQRCKHTIDLPNLTTTPRQTSCPRCSTLISATFTPALLHPSAHRAGTLHISGAVPTDLLPSTFIPTCSDCSTEVREPRITAERGAAPRAVCRKCHAHLSFRLPELRFLNLASYAATHNNNGLPPRKPQRKAKESLGITPGEALPKNGRCKHYGKSYRWFRFSCCGRVFACDRCHDEEVEDGHAVERAERMICGWCSREQRFRPEDCAMCGKSVVRKTGGGFWEGGKGTRDKARMSRKDPRKYKRVGGSKVGSSAKK